MSISTKLKYTSATLLLILFSIFIYSCKEDGTIVDTDPDDPGSEDPVILIVSPYDDDTLSVGSAFDILWLSNVTSEVMIEYTVNNGLTWNVLTSSTANDGLFTWDPVPDSISTNCKVRITALDASAMDVIPGVFRIVRSEETFLNLTKPNGGELLFVGESYSIEWTSNNIEQVKIEFSSNAGNAWNIITPNFPADSGYYIWQSIPNSVSTECLIRISDVNSESLSDISSSAFAIGMPQTINVLAPNGSEAWAAKSSKVITWFSSRVSSVKIEFTSNNGVDWTTISENTPSDGYFSWSPLPDLPTTNARIRITDAEDGYPSDESDAVFTVTPEEALSLSEPNGGEQWLSGSTQYIRWNSSAKTGKSVKGGKNIKSFLSKVPSVTAQINDVKLEFSTNGGSTWTVITESVPNNGTYVWSEVPSANSVLCQIKISDAQDGAPWDLSDSTFTIYNTIQQEVAVTSPNGSEVWPAGTSQQITWTSDGITAVDIDYSTNNGLNWTSIVTNTPSDGYFTWSQVPNIASTICKIRIRDTQDQFPSDVSNSTFTISPEPEITVISPNGGESFRTGSSSNIKWSSTNISDVKIEYTTNGGAKWNLISASSPSDGEYEWENIPNVNSSLCKIKISDADDNNPQDISDNNFTITNQVAQSISVLSPNGGEVWEAGTTHNIVWNATGVSNVKVELTTNNGLVWSTIKDSVPSAGSVEWTPNDINSTQCKIRVSDLSDGAPIDESDAAFSVQPIQTLKVVAPVKGQVLTAGEPFELKWEAAGIEKVKIEYTTTNSIFEDGWFVLVNSVPSKGLEGSFEANFSVASDLYRIRISDAADGSPMAYNEGVFFVKPQPIKSVTVTSPNGTDNWLWGTTQNITWTSTNIANVGIRYTTNNGAEWNNIVENTVSDGLLEWVVPSNISSSLCKIKVYSVADTLVEDVSDLSFTISQVPLGIKINSPNGGEEWEVGSSYNITWTSYSITSVKIDYTTNNGVDWLPIVASTPSDGFYQWNPIPNTPSTNCKIRVSDVITNFVDYSDALFTIAPEPQIAVTSPNGGESFQAGSNTNITWTSTHIENIKLEYTSNNGANWHLIVASTPSDGLYEWQNIPDVSSSLCKIRISDANDGLPFDISDNLFSITNQVVQSITLTSPNGGEKWEAGTSHNITWGASAVSTVKIEYSTNNGNNWTEIVSSISNSGSYEWNNIPDLNSTQCKIKVSDASDGLPKDESNAVFTIHPVQYLRVIYPNGGESILSGIAQTILWESRSIEKVKIEYSINNGNSSLDWFTLVDSIPSTGSYNASFTLPQDVERTDHYRIRISDAADGSPIDYSDGTFTVLPAPSIRVTSPNGGENWLAGTTEEIKWTSKNIENVRLEYTLNGGAIWNTIADVKSNGIYNWTVPTNIDMSSDICLVKISHIENGVVSKYTDESDDFFSLHPKTKLLRLLFPNGGEYIWQDTLITWTSAAVDFVDIEYTIDNGQNWISIANNYPSTGAYYWQMNFIYPSTLARIRIYDSNDPTVTDLSDSYFNFGIKEGLAIINPGGELGDFIPGKKVPIKWKGSNKITNVKLEYTKDGGRTWNKIADNISSNAGTNSYNWIIPNIKGNIILRVTDNSGRYSDSSKQLKIK